jgi:hypothetical protein
VIAHRSVMTINGLVPKLHVHLKKWPLRFRERSMINRRTYQNAAALGITAFALLLTMSGQQHVLDVGGIKAEKSDIFLVQLAATGGSSRAPRAPARDVCAIKVNAPSSMGVARLWRILTGQNSNPPKSGPPA